MNDSETLFIKLTSNQEASMSGGKKADKGQNPNKQPKTVNYTPVMIFPVIQQANGGVASGGNNTIGGSSTNTTIGGFNNITFS